MRNLILLIMNIFIGINLYSRYCSDTSNVTSNPTKTATNKSSVLILLLAFFVNFEAFSQATCAAPQIIASLPYTLASGTACRIASKPQCFAQSITNSKIQ